MDRKNQIESRLSLLKKELGGASLIAVTKYTPLEDAIYCYHAGQFDLGENRVQDFKKKSEEFNALKLSNVRWHFIGNLQTNKVKELLKIKNLHAIHSVSSIKLLDEIIKQQTAVVDGKLDIFFQVNTSLEEEKGGFESEAELEKAIEKLLKDNSVLNFKGLMTMGTIRSENFEDEARRCFSLLKNIKENIERKYGISHLKLSMGMSQDYKIALSLGADYIRIGSLIFKT